MIKVKSKKLTLDPISIFPYLPPYNPRRTFKHKREKNAIHVNWAAWMRFHRFDTVFGVTVQLQTQSIKIRVCLPSFPCIFFALFRVDRKVGFGWNSIWILDCRSHEIIKKNLLINYYACFLSVQYFCIVFSFYLFNFFVSEWLVKPPQITVAQPLVGIKIEFSYHSSGKIR